MARTLKIAAKTHLLMCVWSERKVCSRIDAMLSFGVQHFILGLRLLSWFDPGRSCRVIVGADVSIHEWQLSSAPLQQTKVTIQGLEFTWKLTVQRCDTCMFRWSSPIHCSTSRRKKNRSQLTPHWNERKTGSRHSLWLFFSTERFEKDMSISFFTR